MKFCGDQAVKIDDEQAGRMLIAQCAERYDYLKQAFLLALDTAKPSLETLKAQMRDIDAEFLKKNSGVQSGGQANQVESAWGQGSSSGGSRGGGGGSWRGGRGGRGEEGKGGVQKVNHIQVVELVAFKYRD